jgi:threonine synthase
VAAAEGAWICPEGAACFAAVARLRESGWLAGGDRVVVLNTGAGLKYPETVTAELPTLAAGCSIPAVAAAR